MAEYHLFAGYFNEDGQREIGMAHYKGVFNVEDAGRYLKQMASEHQEYPHEAQLVELDKELIVVACYDVEEQRTPELRKTFRGWRWPSSFTVFEVEDYPRLTTAENIMPLAKTLAAQMGVGFSHAEYDDAGDCLTVQFNVLGVSELSSRWSIFEEYLETVPPQTFIDTWFRPGLQRVLAKV